MTAPAGAVFVGVVRYDSFRRAHNAPALSAAWPSAHNPFRVMRPTVLVFSAAFECSDVLGFAPSGESLFQTPKSNQKACPGHPVFRLGRKMPSLKRSFRGTPRRAIPGPSRLSRHPCRSTPETPLQRGLLNGALGVCGRFSGSLRVPKSDLPVLERATPAIRRQGRRPLTPPTATQSRTSPRTARRSPPRYPRDAARRCSGTAPGRCRCRSPSR